MPLSYDEFWKEVGPLDLKLIDKRVCDQQIQSGHSDERTVLVFLKALARVDMQSKTGLEWKMPTPWLKIVK